MEKVVLVLNKSLQSVMASFIAIMSIIVAGNVFCRYILNFSFVWSAELSAHCMVWGTFFGIAALTLKDEHLVALDLLNKLLKKEKPQRILKLSILFVSGIFYIIITYYSVILVAATRGQTSAAINGVPMNIFYMVIPISGLIMVFGVVVQIYRRIFYKVTEIKER